MHKKLFAAAMAAGILLLPTASEALSLPIEMPKTRATATTYATASNYVNGAYDLNLNANEYKEYSMSIEGQVVNFIAFENIVYVKNPKDVSHQMLNIYIPKAYLDGRTVNGYAAKQAPIFMPNGVGGYMPGEMLKPLERDTMSGKANASLYALSRGCVVVTPAIRGRTTVANNVYVGKAPAFIVDYKAAVAYIRANRDNLPAGDPEKIISNGTSAGGALSALLGTTGNDPDYAPYLQELGAAGTTSNDIFAASVYCPITNLDHADAAYEWIFNGTNEYYSTREPILGQAKRAEAESIESKVANKVKNKLGDFLGTGQAVSEAPTSTKMTQQEIDISNVLKGEFGEYVNSLDLHDENGMLLTLDDKGNGTFKSYIKRKYMESAQAAMDSGANLSGVEWLTIKGKKVTDADLSKYPAYVTRMKAAPAFDKLDLNNPSPENDEFGTEKNIPQHFTMTAKRYETSLGAMADANVIKMMNPMNYIDANATVAEHFRIRHGAADRDTSLAIPAILALKLQARGADVDFFAPWDVGHAGDYDLEELFDWIDFICKKDPTVPIKR